MLLPVDVVVAQNLDSGVETKVVSITKVLSNWRIGDVGPDTIKLFAEELRKCKTVIWNGPLGVFEIPQFAQGTKSIAGILSGLDATTVIGGGSTAEVVIGLGLADKMTHVSTGGGASLDFLQGKTLPGIAALLDKEEK